MHKSTARVVGIACIVIGLARIAAGVVYLLAVPLFGTETPSFPDSLLPYGMGGWVFVLTLPAAVLLFAGGVVLACGRAWGRYLALAYVLFKLGLVFIGSIVAVFGLMNFSGRFFGSGNGYGLISMFLSNSGILPAAFLLVLLVIPTKRRSASYDNTTSEPLPVHETARAEIVRLGWMSLVIAAVGLLMIAVSFIQIQIQAQALLSQATAAPSVTWPWWVMYSMAGHALVDALLFTAGVALLRFRPVAVPLAVVQGVLSFALLVLTQFGTVTVALSHEGAFAANVILGAITSIEGRMPMLLVAVLACLPHIRERLGHAALTIDGQPILDESEMPPV